MREANSVLVKQKMASVPQRKFFRLKFWGLENLFIYLAVSIIVFLTICAIVPQWIAPYSPTEMFSDQILQSPSANHWFGTDYFGRDVFSVVVYGSRYSILIGFSAVLVGGIIGSLIGAIAGHVGGIVNMIFMRLIEILQTIPGLLLALAFAAALGANFLNIVLAVSLASLPSYARVICGQIVSVKNRPYVLASKSIGTSNIMIFLNHVLPNSYPPLLVMASNGLGVAILTGAGLSFLGLGVVSEIPDWGALLSQGRGYLAAAWWIATFPGLAISMFVLSVNIIGDRLRDYFDPKKRIA
ncbi:MULTISPECIES: ABC transporter permease [Bacillus]|uniref:D-ala-D-ala transporter subunit n=2 Tax=Bacillus TaxID=1386 RepID=A0A0M4FT04_9BACI|nr:MULTISPECIES: ABC transporter permease [Bacillus]ALC83073.1 D-ala-D-ala transporter subunit [Bacillus gobiensis]MBP1082117.1 peptide/nickel transport system permease protein [Bacillus capparidis]MED1096740.1 ABC transporter permease [Bacillus capparidis]